MREEVFGFLSKDGRTKIHAVKWLPESGKYRAVLQINHGMVEYIERYRGFAEYMTKQGFLVVGYDHIGHGGSVVSEEELGFFDEKHPSDILVADMHQFRKKLQGENPGKPYFMLAHSMGSYMLRKYLCIHGENLSGAIVMGTGCMPDKTMKLGMTLCRIIAAFRGWHYRSRFMQSLSYDKPYKKYDLTGANPQNSWLTKDVDCVQKYYSDPKCTFLFTVNGYYGLMEAVYFDNQMEHINRMQKDLPILLVSGADDPVGNFGTGVKMVYDKFRTAGMNDVTCKLYESDRHEILNETDKEYIYEDISAWLNKHCI
jgi:alpha-beta hydrolase superfamily lysophospholipase